MKKNISQLLLIMSIGALCMLSACSGKSDSDSGTQTSASGNDATILGNYSANELASHHEPMMVLYHSNRGEEDISSDFWCYEQITVYYDKTIEIEEHYNLSGAILNTSAILTDEDYALVFDFLQSDVMVKSSENEDMNGPDAPSFSYTFYTPDGEEWCRLGSSQVDSAIYPMLKTYIPEYDVPPLYP